ncbi:aminoglycoside phosphotransferase family protein [Cribrihabitans pelagius]|uniref:aminoglycoside phosphotransferase family protein n=1 Tax=Cribrihabitans pelagius TaxID=1765746 RepID=UPI003B5900CA
MTATAKPSDALLEEFGVSDPAFLTETPIARLWRVTRGCGGPAVLKVYRGRGSGGEAAGFGYLRDAPQAQAVRIYAVSTNAALIEWLPGPSIGDTARSGDLAGADRLLLQTARALHAGASGAEASFLPLEERFSALRAFQPRSLPGGRLRDGLERGRGLALHLLATQTDTCALHGDLHHENVRLGARGYCAFDAKGLRGERAYELANAFRHPRGCTRGLQDPDVIRRRADQWSAGLGCSAKRLLAWAAAKCALSVVWRHSEPAETDPETDLLMALLQAHSERE